MHISMADELTQGTFVEEQTVTLEHLSVDIIGAQVWHVCGHTTRSFQDCINLITDEKNFQ